MRDRIRALRVLGRCADPDLAERIVPLLRDRSPHVRKAAVEALGAVGVGAHLSPLIDRLGDADPQVRRAAVHVIGRSKRPVGRRVLLPVLSDSSPMVRRAAVYALKAYGMSARDQRQAVSEVELRQQIDELRAPDAQLRANAVRKLGRSGRAHVVGALLPLLPDNSPLVLGELARALGRIGGDKAQQALVRLGKSPQAEDRGAAATGMLLLAKVPWQAVMALVRDKQADVRLAALGAIVHHPESLLEALVQLICTSVEDGDERVALAAARAAGAHRLACSAQREAIQALARREIARGPTAPLEFGVVNRLVRLLAALGDVGQDQGTLALIRYAYAHFVRDASKWITAQDWKDLDPKPSGSMAQKPSDQLPTGKSRQEQLRWLLSRYPVRQGQERADPLLPPSVGVDQISELLEQLPSKRDARAWLGQLGLTAPPAIREAALKVLAQLPAALPADQRGPSGDVDKIASQAVLAGLAASDMAIRHAASAACVHLGQRAEATALKLLSDKDLDVRLAAAEVVGKLQSRAAVPRLLTLLDQGSQPAVVRALGRIGDARARPRLIDLLDQANVAEGYGERVLLIEALAALGPASSAARAIERELSHPQWRVRLAAARALISVARSGSREALDVCQADFYALVRQACARALDRLRARSQVR